MEPGSLHKKLRKEDYFYIDGHAYQITSEDTKMTMTLEIKELNSTQDEADSKSCFILHLSHSPRLIHVQTSV